MYDDSTNLVTALSTVCGVTYEQWVDSDTTLPHITYMEASNISRIDTNDYRLSTVQYEIKLWAKTKADIVTKSAQIDNIMLSLGYKRSGGREMAYEDMICKIMLYDGTAREHRAN